MKRRMWMGGALVLTGLIGLYLGLARRGYLMPVAAIPSVLCLDGCSAPESVHQPLAPDNWLNQDQPLATLVAVETVDHSKVSILIEKARHRLTLFYQGQPVKAYPIVFGGAPVGDKRREGDRKTPEGIFKIRDQYPHASWSKFLWLDYPNQDSWRKHWQAKMSGQLDWQDTIGGEVGIHGVPDGADHLITEKKNWTLGCPSLRNADVDELYRMTQVGTVVEILP